MNSLEGKDNILGGWLASGITDAIRLGLSALPSIDPFEDIDQLIGVVTLDNHDNIESVCQLTDEETSIGYSRDYSEYDENDEENEIWECEDRGAFDVFQDFDDEGDI